MASLSSEQILAATRPYRLSYRQLDYWVRTRAISPEVEAHGSGTYRRWSPRDAQRLRAIAYVRQSWRRLGGDNLSLDLVSMLWHALEHNDVAELEEGPLIIRVDLAEIPDR